MSVSMEVSMKVLMLTVVHMEAKLVLMLVTYCHDVEVVVTQEGSGEGGGKHRIPATQCDCLQQTFSYAE